MLFRLGLLVLFALLSACRETIVHNLSEAEANRMLAHLDAQSLQVVKEKQADGRWSLSLPEREAAAAIRSLTQNKLFREEYPVLSEKSAFVISREEERFRFERALSREIEATLAGLPAVLQARVHLNLPASDPVFGQNPDGSKSSASVMLITSANGVDKSEVTSLVSGASGVPGAAVAVIVSPNSEINNQPEPVVQGGNSPEAQIPQTDFQPAAGNPGENRKLIKAEYNQIRIFQSASKVFFYFRLIPWDCPAAVFGLPAVFVLVSRILNRKPKLIV